MVLRRGRGPSRGSSADLSPLFALLLLERLTGSLPNLRVRTIDEIRVVGASGGGIYSYVTDDFLQGVPGLAVDYEAYLQALAASLPSHWLQYNQSLKSLKFFDASGKERSLADRQVCLSD